MKGDFSRLKLDDLKHDEAWLQQQGRVWLDSDWNDAVLARLRLLERQNIDFIGISGAPEPGTGFAISSIVSASKDPTPDFAVGGGSGSAGRVYVDGILCQNDTPTTYLTQPDYPHPPPLPVKVSGDAGWTPVGSMTSYRVDHAAAILPDGTVLVIGGRNANGPMASCELYDPETKAWTRATNLNDARFGHSATALADGTVLVAGGIDVYGFPLRSAEMYDPVAKTWMPTDYLVEARAFHAAVQLFDGRVLVAGGLTTQMASPSALAASNVTATVEIYNPPLRTWRGAASLSVPRAYHTATPLWSGTIVLAQIGSLQVPVPLELATRLTGVQIIVPNPASVPFPTTQVFGSGAADVRVLLAGGANADGTVQSSELYDPRLDAMTAGPALSSARALHTATRLEDGRVLLAGGSSQTGPLDSTELVDPQAGSSAGPTLSAARSGHTATLLPFGRVLMAGGVTSDSTVLNSSEIFDPLAAQPIEVLRSMSSSRFGHTATLLQSGQVLVAGGEGQQGSLIYQNPSWLNSLWLPPLNLQPDDLRLPLAPPAGQGQTIAGGAGSGSSGASLGGAGRRLIRVALGGGGGLPPGPVNPVTDSLLSAELYEPAATTSLVAYLQVWRRSVSYLQDPDVRESALGGPDTTIRLRTVAQVKVVEVPAQHYPAHLDCDHAAAYVPRRGAGALSTLAPTQAQQPNDCDLPGSTGFIATDNRLYRVEIHNPGDLQSGDYLYQFGLSAGADAGDEQLHVAVANPGSNPITAAAIDALTGGSWEILEMPAPGPTTHVPLQEALLIQGATLDSTGLFVNLALSAPLRNAYSAGMAHVMPANVVPILDAAAGQLSLQVLAAKGTLPAPGQWLLRGGGSFEPVTVDSVDVNSGTITLHSPLQFAYGVTTDGTSRQFPVLTEPATFKWSRDNGSIAVSVLTATPGTGTTSLTVESLGRDQATALQAGDWVELIGDTSELGPGAGLLCQIAADPDPDQLTVQLNAVAGADLVADTNLLLRRWDGFGFVRTEAASASATSDLMLDDGVHISFSGTDFRTGDYWCFTVRPDGVEHLDARPADGIVRHACPLAILHWVGEGTATLESVINCVPVFAPLTARPKPQWPVVLGVNWANDQTLKLDQFNDGLTVTFSENMHPATLSRDTFLVTLELVPPYDEFGSHMSFVVYGDITGDGNTWTFRPWPPIALPMLNRWLERDGWVPPPHWTPPPESTFTVKDVSGATVFGVVANPTASSLTYTPPSPFAAGQYTVILSGKIRDQTGNALNLGQDVVWNFTVAPPQGFAVLGVDPTGATSCQPLPIAVVLNAPVDLSTVMPGTTLLFSDTASPGTYRGWQDAQGDVMTFVPAGVLTPGHTYRLELTGGVLDTTGRPLNGGAGSITEFTIAAVPVVNFLNAEIAPCGTSHAGPPFILMEFNGQPALGPQPVPPVAQPNQPIRVVDPNGNLVAGQIVVGTVPMPGGGNLPLPPNTYAFLPQAQAALQIAGTYTVILSGTIQGLAGMPLNNGVDITQTFTVIGPGSTSPLGPPQPLTPPVMIGPTLVTPTVMSPPSSGPAATPQPMSIAPASVPMASTPTSVRAASTTLALGGGGGGVGPFFITGGTPVGQVPQASQVAVTFNNPVDMTSVQGPAQPLGGMAGFGGGGGVPLPKSRGIRCRLRLMGNFILEETGERQLDGDVFGQPVPGGYSGPGATELLLPSGDNVKGGDFESWFFLVPPAAALLVDTIVPINQAVFTPPALPPSQVVVTFSKEVQMASVTTASFGVYDDAGVLVPGRLDPFPFTSGAQLATRITFSPTAGAFPVTLGKRNTFSVILRGTDPSPILDADGLPLNGGTGDFVSSFAIDAPNPASIVSVDPAGGTTVTAPPAVITVTISKAVQMSSVTAQTFQLLLAPQAGGAGNVSIPGSIGPQGPTASVITFTPTSWAGVDRTQPAVLSIQLTGTGGSPIVDVDGIPLQGGADYLSSFTIEAAFTATVAPQGNQATAPAAITATFTDPVGALPDQAFGLLDHNGSVVAGTAAISPASPMSAVWTPANALADGIYTIVLSGAITDANGQALNNGHGLTFTLSIGPALLASITVNQVPRPQVITATFTDAVGPVTSATFTLTDPTGQPVAAAVAVAGAVATLTPNASLSPGNYTARLSGTIQGAGGQQFNGGMDLVAPVVIEPAFTVSGVSPSGVSPLPPANNQIVATFTDPVDGASVTLATFQVLDAAGSPIGATSVSASGSTAVLTVPMLAPGAYTIQLSGQIKDLVGEQLNGGAGFTVPLSILAFTVTAFEPQGTIGSGPPRFAAQFSAPVASATVTAGSFYIQTATPGQYRWLARSVGMVTQTQGELVPVVQMPSGTYTAFLTGAITDVAGRPLNAGAGASFPIIIQAKFNVVVTPLGQVADLLAGGELTATFSAAFDPATVNPPAPQPFILRNAAGGVVQMRYLVRSQNVLVLVAPVALPAGDYVAEVSGKVLDLELKVPVNNGQNASFPLRIGKGL